MLLTEECKCINWNVAANVSLGCIVHQHCLNRYDFNRCLKTGRLREGSLKSSGRLFQRAGPEVAKLRSPIAFVFVLGTRISPRAVERRRERAETVDFCTSISVRYAGAMPWRHLETRRPSLKSISERVGSQRRRSRMSAEIGSNLRFRRTRRAAIRITVCSWSIKPSPIPASRLLQ